MSKIGIRILLTATVAALGLLVPAASAPASIYVKHLEVDALKPVPHPPERPLRPIAVDRVATWGNNQVICGGVAENDFSGTVVPNTADEDGDGRVNDGCPSFGPAETPAQCVPGNTADEDNDSRINDGCPVDEAEAGAQCDNTTDDDGDGKVNDGCPVAVAREVSECFTPTDEDGDGTVNDGCEAVGPPESGVQCDNATDDDGDSRINDGCPAVGAAENIDECDNAVDDNGNGKVNEGCSTVGGLKGAETDPQCQNATDDDGDGKVNDGCPPIEEAENPGAQCNNASDEDGDRKANDGCPVVVAATESGSQCENAVDDNANVKINEGCPPVGAPELALQCGDGIDNGEDSPADGKVDDGCPAGGEPETYFTQAGGHPDVRLRFDFCENFNILLGFNRFCSDPERTFDPADLIVELPPGFLGDPTLGGAARCPYHMFLLFSCATLYPQSIVGTSISDAIPDGGNTVPVETQLFSVETLGFEPARLGTGSIPATPPGPLSLQVKVRTESDAGVSTMIAGLPNRLGGLEAAVGSIDTILYSTNNAIPKENGGKYFFVNPTSCTPKHARVSVTSYQERDIVTTKKSNPIIPSGCRDQQATANTSTPASDPPFDLDVKVKPDNEQAGAATGYTVKLEYPDYQQDDVWQAQLRHAKVTLPEGVSLSPGGGVGLEACSFEQFYGPNVHDSGDYAKRTDDPDDCPATAQIGRVFVDSPVLPSVADDPDGEPYDIAGKAFFGPTGSPGRPTASNPWKLFLLLEGHGIRLKLPAGDVTVNDKGQVTTEFRDNPEVPFTTFKLKTNGGPTAPLANPRFCGPHFGEAVLTSWADTDDSTPSRIVSPPITPEITGCLDPEPFVPTLDEASTNPTQAGAFTVSRLRATRPDGHQLIKKLQISLPVGAVGSLSAVPLCEAATAAAGACGEESKIGIVRSTVGYGDAVLTIAGSLYLAKPSYDGDAATIVAVVPTKVGPIDLGQPVILLNRIRLRESDTGIDVIPDERTPIPSMVAGVPLAIKKVEISTDRDGFFINPTGCDVRNANVTFTSDQGATAVGTAGGAATGCDALPFSPKLRMIVGTKGQTGVNQNPPLKAIVTQAAGEANIGKARVVVPDIIRPDLPQIQKPGALCTGVQLDARACPALSQVGDASVITPVLPFPLRGPVYIVLKPGSPLPSLAVLLRGGGFEVRLNAGNGFQGIRILNTFDSVPDVPQSRFRLSVKGGADGILLNQKDLCTTTPLPTVDYTFTGQNGKSVTGKPSVDVRGCATVGAQNARLTIASRVVKVTKKGIAAIKLRCGSGKACRGKLSLPGLGSKSFSIARGKSKSVKVKLSRKGFRSVRKKSSLRLRIAATVRGGKRATKKITFKAPR